MQAATAITIGLPYFVAGFLTCACAAAALTGIVLRLGPPADRPEDPGEAEDALGEASAYRGQAK